MVISVLFCVCDCVMCFVIWLSSCCVVLFVCVSVVVFDSGDSVVMNLMICVVMLLSWVLLKFSSLVIVYMGIVMYYVFSVLVLLDVDNCCVVIVLV